MATMKASSAWVLFDRERILSGLRQAQEDIIAGIKSYEEKLEDWRKTAPMKFADWAMNFNPGVDDWRRSQRMHMEEWAPPIASGFCNDMRVQQLNRIIGRVIAMAGDEKNPSRVKLRQDDEAFSFIGIEICQ